MASLPYIQLYIADYLADTAHLTTTQHGAYLLLIFNYWQKGHSLNNADDRLARVVGMTKKEFLKNKGITYKGVLFPRGYNFTNEAKEKYRVSEKK